MNKSVEALGKVIHHTKYARHLPHKSRRETYRETVQRNEDMHFRRFQDELPEDVFQEFSNKLWEAYDLVHDKKILPSMRSMQFAGEAIERNHARMYNCAYLPIKDVEAFRETMFLLLSGCGVGYSVQRHHVEQLPKLREPVEKQKYVVGDTIEGWADAVDALVSAYLYGTTKPVFDFSMVRPKGSPLRVSGGKAPGPEPLARTLEKIDEIFCDALSRGAERLRPLDVHDIQCHIADAVLSGGIRRSAMIALFSPDDEEMVRCKDPENISGNFHRYRSNNSAVELRDKAEKESWDRLWEVSRGLSGEPGYYFANSLEDGTNPCAEIGLNAYQFCCLVEINGAMIETQEEFNLSAQMAARIATIQASYTDFHYLREVWRKQTEEEALIGVGITGIVSGNVMNLDLTEAAKIVVRENAEMAELLGINPSARCTTVKPSGTTSSLLGCSSGVHAWHSDYYLRNVRFNKMEPIAQYLMSEVPEICADNVHNPEEIVVSFPMAAPKGSPTRDAETTKEFLDRVFKLNVEWVRAGHNYGDLHNNVSATANIRAGEGDFVGEYLWENRHKYNGISVFPYSGAIYEQAPFEACAKDVYDEYMGYMKELDLTKIREEHDNTDLQGEIACAGGACEV